MPNSRPARQFPLRHFGYVLLWTVFLLLQVFLFVPVDDHNHYQQQQQPPQSTSSSGSSGSRRAPVGGKEDALSTNEKVRSLGDNLKFKAPRPTGDALVNNIDVYFRTAPPPPSDYHCIERDFSNDPILHANYSWMFTSCHFQNLCLDTATQEFVLVTEHSYDDPPALALGSINPRWSGRGHTKGFHKVKWFPRTIKPTALPAQGYYQLPDDVIMVPFHSMAAHNVGHLLWDDFYPLYTLLELFGFASRDYQHLLLRWTAQEQLYATCEMQKKKSRQCQENLQRFLPLLGVDPTTFSTVKKVELKGAPIKSTYVCSKHAVAGIGMLSDHGLRDHGWLLPGANSVPHNIGRGTIFRSFRNYMVSNMGLPSELQASTRKKITFSTHSSKGFERSLGFENQSAAIQRALQQESDNPPPIQCITMRELSLPEQIQVALESAIYITVSGGGAVTATFLPPGASLIVYYLEDGGFDYWNTSYTYTPARLDWDLLNNAGHLRVHWLPMKSMNTRSDLDLLEQLVRHELQIKGLAR